MGKLIAFSLRPRIISTSILEVDTTRAIDTNATNNRVATHRPTLARVPTFVFFFLLQSSSVSPVKEGRGQRKGRVPARVRLSSCCYSSPCEVIHGREVEQKPKVWP